MLIGYARVSTNEQNLDLQLDALRQEGVSDADIFTDKITGTKAERPGLSVALSHLIELVNHLAGQGIAFKSLTERIDTASATGKLVFHIFGALAEFERNLIKERTIAGLSAARARGRLGGRPRLNPKTGKVALARKLYADKSNSISDICKTLHISRATLYRYVK